MSLPILSWRESILTNRTQAVIIEGEKSTYDVLVESGVPQ
jgi:hypothetical protein